MRNVFRITKEGKVRPIRRRAADAILVETRGAGLIALIQTLIPSGVHAVGDVLEAEVTDLAEERCRPPR